MLEGPGLVNHKGVHLLTISFQTILKNKPMTSGLLPGYKTIIRDAKLFSKVWVEITSILIKPK